MNERLHLLRLEAQLEIVALAARQAKSFTDEALAAGVTQEEINALLDQHIPYYPTEESS